MIRAVSWMRSCLQCSPTASFALIGSGLYVVYVLGVSLPSLDRLLWESTGFSVLGAMGAGPLIGTIKLRLLTGLAIFCVATTIVWFAVQWRRSPGRAARAVIAAALLVPYGASAAMFYRPAAHAGRIKSLRIVEPATVDYESIFAKQPLLQAPIESYDDLYQYCHWRFQTYRSELSQRWGINDQRKLEALFYMNFVSRLWGYGNPTPELRDRPGGVLSNEETGFRQIQNPTVRTYLESDIGCCTDYAFLLKQLLGRAGILNRRVTTAGHVFNEARFADGWATLDANTNMFFAGEWAAIQRRPHGSEGTVKIMVFPHQNCTNSRNPYYRPEIGQFRLRWLLTAVERTAPPLSYPDGRVVRSPGALALSH